MPAKKTVQRKGVDQLTLLGNTAAKYPAEYTPDVLEAVPSPAAQDYWVKFNCPEFTSLCPKTGQPDYATITISYVPDKLIVESKSLKLYLFGFRNHGAFHEDVVNIIRDDLVKLLKPRYIEVWAVSIRLSATLFKVAAASASNSFKKVLKQEGY